MRFVNRKEAGKQLAKALARLGNENVVVYALPRGGVAVGFEVALALKAPLDIVIARKIGHPHNPEYAVCATTEAGELVCNESERALIDPTWLKSEAEQQQQEALRRRKVYLGDLAHIPAHGKIAVVVDDGVATGLTMLSALRSIRKQGPKELIAAVPVAPYDTLEVLRGEADSVVALEGAGDFLGAVGAYYDDFSQMTDKDVVKLLFSSRSKYPQEGT